MAAVSASPLQRFNFHGGLLPAATLVLIILMVIPIPAFLLDVGFIANIMISLAVLMVALNVARPLDFSSFPAVLLFATLFRLSLNVASTRVVLVDGHTGPDAAGHVIEAFGSFMIGGDYVVGIFVFIILMIINLVVIAKGAGRVSEVSARFVLDALPGKQMAIDADLNAGLLTPDEAKRRRQEVATESDFYGSMDGASKFVKGDAIASVIILVISIVGGLVLGVVSHGMSISDAASTYIHLAIGDALVAQIPALLLSIAAASIVTRVSSPLDLSGQIFEQFGSSRAWYPVAGILALIGFLPGMPNLLILSAAAGAGYLAFRLQKSERLAAEAPPEATPVSTVSVDWNSVCDTAPLELKLGFGLVGLVDEQRGGTLMARITGIRKHLSKDLGFVIPVMRVRDEMNIPPNSYRIAVGGVEVASGELWPDDLLAIDSGELLNRIEGPPTKDPTFGLDAVWIPPAQRAEAIVAGYTVVDAPSVAATHINQIIKQAAHELFTVDEAQQLVDHVKESSPQLISSLTPAPLSMLSIAAICRALLAEAVPLRDFPRIAVAMADSARTESDPIQLVEDVRRRIGGLIVQTIAEVGTPLGVVTLDAQLEGLISQAVRAGQDANHPIEPKLANRIVESISDVASRLFGEGRNFAIVTSPLARRALSRLLAPHIPGVPVMSFLEIPESRAVEVLAVVGQSPAPTPALLEAAE